MRIPTYHDGKPTNLQAAILDAMYWLRLLRSRQDDELERSEHLARLHPEFIEGLRRAIRALEEYLPDAEPASEDTEA